MPRFLLVSVAAMVLVAKAPEGQSLPPRRAPSGSLFSRDSVKTRLVLPVRNKVEARAFFNEPAMSFLTQVRAALNGDQGSIATDLLTAYGGPIRVAFGASIASTDAGDADDSESASTNGSLEAFFAGGGHAYFTFALPLIAAGKESDDASVALFLLPRLGFVLPSLGQEVEDVSANLDAGVEAYLQFLSTDQPIQLFASGRAGWVSASNAFASAIGASDERSFFLGQFSVGAVLSSAMRLAFTGAFGAPAVLDERLRSRLTVQVVPGQR